MAAAFAKAGVEKPEDVEQAAQRLFERNIDKEIKETAKDLPGADTVQNELDAARKLAPEHATLLGQAARALDSIHRNFPDTKYTQKIREEGAGGKFGRMALGIQEKFDEIADRNPFALEEYHRQKDARDQQRRNERRQAFNDSVSRIRDAATIKSLHEACEPDADGTFALRREVPVLNESREPMTFKDARGNERIRTRTVWDLYQVSDYTAQLIDSTAKSAVEKSGEYRVPFNPPTFQTERGQPFFNRTTREALAALYEREGKRAVVREEIQSVLALRDESATFHDLAENKKCTAAGHIRTWKMPKCSPGRLTVAVTGTGRGNISLVAFAGPSFRERLEPILGEKAPLEKVLAEELDRENESFATIFLNNFFRARLPYEKKVASREDEEIADEETDKPDEQDES